MGEPKHLWEVDHPYYMNEGSYFASGWHHECYSWAQFIEEYGDLSENLNLVFRWDWARHILEECPGPHDECGDRLTVFFILQRKAATMSVSVKVTEDDEPATLKYLTPKARHIALLWEPIWQGGAA